MRKSKFTNDEKIEILKEKEHTNQSIEEICVKYGISFATFYNWKRELLNRNVEIMVSMEPEVLKKENTTLRNLYINLSEHNYQLAKFLSK